MFDFIQKSWRPKCIFVFTKELKKSAVYSDWEEKQKSHFFRITDLHVADFFVCVCAERVCWSEFQKENLFLF